LFEPVAEAVEDVEPDVAFELEVEVGFPLALFLEVVPPQPTKVAAARMTKQIFTPDSPALIWKEGISPGAGKVHALAEHLLTSEFF